MNTPIGTVFMWDKRCWKVISEFTIANYKSYEAANCDRNGQIHIYGEKYGFSQSYVDGLEWGENKYIPSSYVILSEDEKFDLTIAEVTAILNKTGKRCQKGFADLVEEFRRLQRLDRNTMY